MGYSCHTFTKCPDIAVGREESGNFGIGGFERYFRQFFFYLCDCWEDVWCWFPFLKEFTNIFFPSVFFKQQSTCIRKKEFFKSYFQLHFDTVVFLDQSLIFRLLEFHLRLFS